MIDSPPNLPYEPSRPRRPFKKWLTLLAVWTIGLLLWAVYLAMFLVIVFRILI